MSTIKKLHSEFDRLRPTVICPASGWLKHDYLVPGGYYRQMWDWDGFFIGLHLLSRNPQDAKYLKWWAFSFLDARDETGYVPGCITPDGPEAYLGHFPMKPFLAQGCYIAARALDDFSWLVARFEDVKAIVQRREVTNFDSNYGLFFWDNAMQSGADNNPAISNDPDVAGQVLSCDINVFMLREYRSLAKIAESLGNVADVEAFAAKSEALAAAINNILWFDEDDSYFNVRRDTGEVIRRVSYSNFLPLVEKLAVLDRGKRMVSRYLWNRDHMLSDFGLRSLSKQDPDYNNECIIKPYSNWRGPIWPIANYLYGQSLLNYGFVSEARELSQMLAELCLRDIESCGSMHENYDAETGNPLAPVAEQFSTGVFEGFVGWNLLVENFAVEVDGAPSPLTL